MLKTFFFILISEGVHSAREGPKYDMSCDCGKREMNEIAKKDCQESAMLESTGGKRCPCSAKCKALRQRNKNKIIHK